MNLDLISVIIPAYKAEKIIASTLESIISQDYENLEIIIVNDASPDKTSERAQKVLEKSNRAFKIINHAKNQGECAARNTGINNSHGKYIICIDDDDLIEKNFLSRLHALISENNCNIAFCGLIDRFSDKRPDKAMPINLSAPFVRSGRELLYLRLTKKFTPPHTCAILMNKKFLDENNLRYFNGYCPSGDIEFQIKVFCCAKRAAFTNECLYIYMHHPAMVSITENNSRDKKILYYEKVTDSMQRYTEYLCMNSDAEKIKYIAENILTPQNLVRRANLFIMKNDKDGYKNFLRDPDIRKILYRSQKIYILLKAPEICIKAFILLHMPKIYYMLRKK